MKLRRYSAGKEEGEANKIRMEHQKNMLPHFLEALWNASALDIDSTLRHVCDKVGPHSRRADAYHPCDMCVTNHIVHRMF